METRLPIGIVDSGPGTSLEVLDRLVFALGSTFDVDEIADRTLPVLVDGLGYHDPYFVLIDDLRQSLAFRGNQRPDDTADHWTLTQSLAQLLRSTDSFVRIGAEHLPRSLSTDGSRVAIRLTDGRSTVGLVLLRGNHVVESIDPHEETLVRTIGALVGATLSRALVHEALVHVTDRLENAQRLQQHILDHVSHEFNTPLMILRSAAEFADTDDATERSMFLDMHSQALDRLENLVQGVLEVARSRADGTSQRLTVAQLEAAVIEPLIEQGAWTGGDLQVWIDLSTDAEVIVDADGLSLSIEHLLRNAWSFAGEAGEKMAIAVYFDHASAWKNGERSGRLEAGLSAISAGDREILVPTSKRSSEDVDRLVVEVIDRGIGIPADEVELVFEPFTQARNSPLRGVSGAGMGLPTCRKRIESMGGEVCIESEEGRGTAVALLVPFN